MRKLSRSVYLGSHYGGVCVGALLFSTHTVLIDAPLRPEDGRAWVAGLEQAGASHDSSLIYLDAHPDRTLGTQTLQAPVLAHAEVARQMSRRAAVFKTLRQETGAEWEATQGLTGLRMVLPNLTFTHTMQLHFDDKELLLVEKTGVSPGACWLVVPEEQSVFVGDALTLGEPPFLAQADIPLWLEQLDELQTRPYKDFTFVAGRGGVAELRDVKQMQALLKDLHSKLRAVSRAKNMPAELDKLAVRMVERYKPAARARPHYVQRMRFGMQEYIARHFSDTKRK